MTAVRGEVAAWSAAAVRHLLDVDTCPVCGAAGLVDQLCRTCLSDFRGEIGAELWAASQHAASALQERQAVLQRVPLRATAAPASEAAVTPASPTVVVDAIPGTPRSSATVQSVIAVAGAGLFAVGAIVFTFFNPDLTDRAVRSAIVGLITLVFLAGAWLFARRGLSFSAEAVGALGLVFVALDVQAFSQTAPPGTSSWLHAAAGTLLAGGIMVAAAARAGIRSWLWVSVVGLSSVPAMLGYASGTALGTVVGSLGAGLAAIALLALVGALAPRFDGALRAERVALTVVQVAAIALAVVGLGAVEAGSPAALGLVIAGTFAAIALLAGLAARRMARGMWSFFAGAAAVASIAALPLALDVTAPWVADLMLALIPAGAAAALVVFGALTRLPASLAPRAFRIGALATASVTVVPVVLSGVLTGGTTVVAAIEGLSATAALMDPIVLATAGGLGAMAAGLGGFAIILRREWSSPSRLGPVAGAAAVWLATLAALVVACLPALAPWAHIAVALGLVFVAGAALRLLPTFGRAPVRLRLPVVAGMHLAVVLAGVISWTDSSIVVAAGVAIVAAVAVLGATMPWDLRPLYVGVGYAYALVVFATALNLLGVGTIALLCLTTSVGSIGAMVATFVRRVGARSWYAVLIVTAVPFLIGVLQVVFERSGWTALSTGLMLLLAATLFVTRRSGLGTPLRGMAAAILVPSLAVVVVCLGAQVLSGSASPVTLPIIAAIVALVLPATPSVRALLERRGLPGTDARVAQLAIEGSTLLTGAIAVLLALVRDAAGLGTTFVVLVIVGIGAAATSVWAHRRYGWWVAAASFTGALWCVWSLAGIDTLEPYLLPPALGTALVGAVLTARGKRGLPLYATGLALAVLPVLAVLAVDGSAAGATAAWRGYALVAAAWALVVIGRRWGRGSSTAASRLAVLRIPTLVAAIAAGAAAAVQGVRFGLGLDTVQTGVVPLFVVCLALGLAGAIPAASAGLGIRSAAAVESRIARSRWLLAPAALIAVAGPWTAIERDWFVIWAMWALMLVLLVVMVLVARRLRTHPTPLPPVWFLFALAFVTAVVAWSPRDLRVEWFSLPLGLFLLTAGALWMHHPAQITLKKTLESWPAGCSGSWALLAPGITVMMLASIVATFTDPLTWRAILVIVIALASILIGAFRRLAAPFLIGVLVLPVENVFVFAVQIGRGVESMPWWITLAVVGAVLLIIAVSDERRVSGASGIAARLRDLA